MDKRRILKHALRTIGVLALALVISALFFFLFIVPQMEIAGATDEQPTFSLHKELALEKTGPGGVKYSVNNSVATFDLDVLARDRHAGKLFPDYASALGYCRKHDLATIPSVQLIQGKLKQVDDRLCAALETAVNTGAQGGRVPGKREALKLLLEKLLVLLKRTPEKHRPAVRKAIVHVATALELGGVKPQLPEDLVGDVRLARDQFLSHSLASRPIGFWDGSEELKSIFRQDRYLSGGLSLSKDLPVCLVLAATIAGDSGLSAAFARMREFNSKICNPPVYIDPAGTPAPPVRCASFSEVAALLPAGVEGTMKLVIDAVKSGRLKLEPRPDSGWYDYQWHALETLLVPERGRESLKLRMSDLYRERLENAFKTSLTKHRETHIKHLPVITMGMSIQEDEPVPVEIAPEFRVEPTATVYLRYARAYRFLANAMRGVFGGDALAKIPVEGKKTADEELRDAALLCYGLYELLRFDVGQLPEYLTDEISGEERVAARKEAADWLANLAGDADLAADTRFAAPICSWPGGPVRYWGTGGVYLERVEYRYRCEPAVGGNVEATFVPAVLYLATDVFLEFERSQTVPLTRAEYRAICDRHGDEDALRAGLGAPPRPRRGAVPWKPLVWCLLALVATALAWRYRTRLRALWERRPKRLLLKGSLGAVGLLITLIVLLCVWPRFRVWFLVRYFAPINVPTGLMTERILADDASLSEIDALADMLDAESPQVRYLASHYLEYAWEMRCDEEGDPTEIPNIKERLQSAADDEVPAVAGSALYLLGNFPDE
ncbi:MAG: hypothetical protein ACYTGB_20865, partial [Planctomycetota bacterium]